MEEEKETVEVSEETKETKTEKPKLFKKPKANPYKKHDDASDPEIEAFAKGELEKFHREKAETATVQEDTEASKEIASSDDEATPSTERPENAEERVFKKRYDDLKRHYDSTLGKHKDEVRTLRTQLDSSNKQIIPPKSKEELEAWKKEYPDVYEMVETIAMNKADTRAKEMETKYQNLQVQQEQINREKAEVELLQVHPDYKEMVIDKVDEAIKNKFRNLDYIHKALMPNGKEKWFQAIIKIKYNKNNEAIIMNGISQDITELYITRLDLEKSKLRLKLATQVAKLGTWEENHKTGELYWSKILREMFALHDDIIIKQNIFWDLVHPEDIEWMKSNWTKAENDQINVDRKAEEESELWRKDLKRTDSSREG